MIEDVTGWLEIAVLIIAIATAVAGLFRWANRGLEKKISDELREATRQIKTDANGGQSLNDVNKHVNQLATKVGEYIDFQREVDRKRDGQIEELRYEIGIAKRMGAWPNGE